MTPEERYRGHEDGPSGHHDHGGEMGGRGLTIALAIVLAVFIALVLALMFR